MPVMRSVKNIVKNYTEAEVKVREATSNDPWGPSSTLMAEIADLTYNVVAFTEIMQMIWKRLNDHGKNWRHVYKSLTLLEYIIKTGSEKVAQQCKENIFAIQTLKDFQHLEDNKDLGTNVREKAKALVALLKDDERLKNERAKALKAKERFTETFGIGSDFSQTQLGKPRYRATGTHREGTQSTPMNPEIEEVRPHSAGEEELQLQLALAMSKEEADNDAKKRTNDELKLQLALEESKKEQDESLLDFAGAGVAASNDPWSTNGRTSNPPVVQASPFSPPIPSGGHSVDPWSTVSQPSVAPARDPWDPTPPPQTVPRDPWAPAVTATTTVNPWDTPPTNRKAASSPWDPQPSNGSNGSSPWHNQPSSGKPLAVDDDFDILGSRTNASSTHTGPISNGDVFSMQTLQDSVPMNKRAEPKKPEDFLGPNATLVNLDNLVTKPAPRSTMVDDQQRGMANPFSGSTMTVGSNPFATSQQAAPSLNQISASTQQPFQRAPVLQNPMMPVAGAYPSAYPNAYPTGYPAMGASPWPTHTSTNNPFL